MAANLPLHQLRLLARRAVPRRLHRPAATAVLRLAALTLRGDAVACPCCGATYRRFLRYPNELCPRCRAYERHRMLCLYFGERNDLLARGARVLHVAPEECLQRRLLAAGVDYVSIDLDYPLATFAMDVRQMTFPSDSFDFVLCVQVLDSLDDDRDGMREIFRVLKPGGRALFQTPLHLRAEGPAFAGRLEEVGFSVEVDRYAERLANDVVERHRLLRGEDVYLCTKPPAAVRPQPARAASA